eukprot:scaffold10863_cov22-Prasinocladus_malaysianus.AAC.1
MTLWRPSSGRWPRCSPSCSGHAHHVPVVAGVKAVIGVFAMTAVDKRPTLAVALSCCRVLSHPALRRGFSEVKEVPWQEDILGPFDLGVHPIQVILESEHLGSGWLRWAPPEAVKSFIGYLQAPS